MNELKDKVLKQIKTRWQNGRGQQTASRLEKKLWSHLPARHHGMRDLSVIATSDGLFVHVQLSDGASTSQVKRDIARTIKTYRQ